MGVLSPKETYAFFRLIHIDEIAVTQDLAARGKQFSTAGIARANIVCPVVTVNSQ